MTAIEAARLLVREWDEGNLPTDRECWTAIHGLIAEHEELLAKYDALRMVPVYRWSPSV